MLATESGKQLSELIDYVNLTSSEIIRALRNGLSFQDNFNAKVLEVELRENISETVNTDGRQPSMIFIGRVFTGLGVEAFGWVVNQDGTVSVKAKFSPTATVAQRVTLLIIY